jgi:hypothetical protein
MDTSRQLNRRHFLRGIGVALALPALESFLGSKTYAAAVPQTTSPVAGTPVRMAFVYVPNGVIGDRWNPIGVGSDFQLNETMKPLSEFRGEFQVISGLEHQNGRAGGDGGGDHARATATILTGARPKKTAGSDIRLGVSVDQVAASEIGKQTRFASLELSCDGVRKSGACDSGYSCAYQFNLAWRSDTQPVAPESNPRLVFERLFGTGARENDRSAQAAAAQIRARSLLDFVREDAKQLQGLLGKNDRHKLDEYLTGVREVEQRLRHMEEFGPLPKVGVAVPDGTPQDYQAHIRLMMDMLVLAFQTDSTRVSTFLMAHDGSNRSFQQIGVPEGHHDLSHHQDDAAKIAKLTKIDLFYSQQLAYLLKRLKETKESNGKSLLDNSMIVYCSGLSDGNRHAHDKLPVILAGRGGGLLHPGSHTSLTQATPMSNLHLSLLRKVGVKAERFGDSTGVLQGI